MTLELFPTETISDKPSMVEGLLNDWIEGRNAKTFVTRGDSIASGWEDSSTEGYCRKLVSEKKIGTELGLKQEAYRVCSARLKALLPGKNVTLKFHRQRNSTNSKWVYISTEVLDCKALNPFQRIDVMIGATIHEAAHILYTDFSPTYVKTKFQKTILNILEDERIEMLIGLRFPGYALYLETLKNFYFDYQYEARKIPHEAKQAFDTFFKIIRYPKYIDTQLVLEHAEFLSKVKDVITPYPDNFISCYNASVKVEELFLEYFKLNLKNNANGDISAEEIGEQIAEAMTSSSGGIQSPNDSAHIGRDDDKLVGDDDQEFEAIEQVIEGQGTYDEKNRTYLLKAKPNLRNYQPVAKSLKGQAALLAKVFKFDFGLKKKEFYSNTGIEIDDILLVDGFIGEKNIYRNVSPNNQKKLSIMLLIDESGSMQGHKIQKAQQVAIALQMAIKSLSGAELFIYGFTSDYHGENTNTLTVYHEPGLSLPGSLGSLDAKACNRDGVLLRAACNHVRRKTKDKTLVFMISDGSPSANHYYEVGIEDTKLAVEEVEKMNFVVFQIGIETQPEEQRRMFTRFCNLENNNNLVINIRKLITNQAKHILS